MSSGRSIVKQPQESSLLRSFYDRDSLVVARGLIGCLLVRRLDGEVLSGRIVETEAYGGSDDPASHAFHGPRPRNLSMFGPPGHLYVYRSHGIHFCANVVTSTEGVGTAVLLRAVEPVAGLEVMRVNRLGAAPTPSKIAGMGEGLLCAGPGRMCQAFGINLSHDGIDLLTGELIIVAGDKIEPVAATPRIGIRQAADFPWRFIDPTSRFLSRPAPRSVKTSQPL